MTIIRKTLALLVASALVLPCCNPIDNPEPGPGTDDTTDTPDVPDVPDGPDGPDNPDPEPEEAVTATLTYQEAAGHVKGYDSPDNYTNAHGTWTICAYDHGQALQLNSSKVSYIGSPVFSAGITKITLELLETYSDDIYICDGPENSNSSILKTIKVNYDRDVEAVLDGSMKQLWIRSGACLRIKAIYLTYGGSGEGGSGEGGSGEGGEGGSGDDTGGSGDDGGETGDDNPPVPVTVGGWYELPVFSDSDHNGQDDNDPDRYYASHSFSMSGRKYRNYTVCYSGEHHCPLWVAAPRHSCYVGGTGRTDAYGRDPDVPAGIQYSSKSTGGGCNKGHMLGSAERTCCSEANRQVFYYTNIAPQLSSGFNTGGGGWNTLEDWVDGQVCRDTLYEVIGCYFDKYTDGYGKTVSPSVISFGGRSDVVRPAMFYYILLRTKKGTSGKALKDCSSSELKCAAFVRSHTNDLKGQKVTSREMMSVADLEKITGLTYFANVPQAPKSNFSASDWGL